MAEFACLLLVLWIGAACTAPALRAREKKVVRAAPPGLRIRAKSSFFC